MSESGIDIFNDPTYIVLNVPAPIADEVRNIRSFCDPERANGAIEISLCGSNGKGTICAGQDMDDVFSEADRIASMEKPFRTNFSSVERFPDTDIYYYTLENPEPFERLHKMFVASSIKFNPTDYAYEPHCTLKMTPLAGLTEEQILNALCPPDEIFTINTLSIYSLTGEQLTPRLLHRVNLGA